MGFVTAEVYIGLLFERDERWRRIGIRLSIGEIWVWERFF